MCCSRLAARSCCDCLPALEFDSDLWSALKVVLVQYLVNDAVRVIAAGVVVQALQIRRGDWCDWQRGLPRHAAVCPATSCTSLTTRNGCTRRVQEMRSAAARVVARRTPRYSAALSTARNHSRQRLLYSCSSGDVCYTNAVLLR